MLMDQPKQSLLMTECKDVLEFFVEDGGLNGDHHSYLQKQHYDVVVCEEVLPLFEVGGWL
jgi:hypothetical protein